MIARTVVRFVILIVVLGAAVFIERVAGSRVTAQDAPTIVIPKAYTDHDLRDWATPLPALGLRPGFFSEAEFERIPAPRLYRSYPVYHPDREPTGYWEWLQKQPPKPLLEPDTLHTERDWIEAGRIVFRELYRAGPQSNTELIPLARSRDALERAGVKPRPDGTLSARWVVTPDGIRLAMTTCQSCHTIHA